MQQEQAPMTNVAPTSNVAPVDFVPTSTMEKGKASKVSPNEIFLIPDMPPYYDLAHHTS